MGGDTELLGELAAMFVKESPALLQGIRTAIECGESGSLEHAAHKLKGVVGEFRAHAAYERAAKLETLGGEYKIDGAIEVFDALTEEVDRVREFLTAFTGDVLQNT